MGLLSGVLDHDPVLYVMTLGVLEAHRHRGLATNLIAIACQHAYETRCGLLGLALCKSHAAPQHAESPAAPQHAVLSWQPWQPCTA